MVEDQPVDKRGFAYVSVGSRSNTKHWIGTIACVAVACLGAGVGIGVFVAQRSDNVQVNAASPPTTTAPSPSLSDMASGSSPPPIPTTRPTIYLVGDTHTQAGSDANGWATRLQAQYVRSVDIVNRGLDEFNTQQFVDTALPIVASELNTTYTPALITLWFGTNDAALEDGPEATRHVNSDTFHDNLVHIIRTFRKRLPRAKILVIAPMVVDDNQRRASLLERGESIEPPDRTNDRTATYAKAAGEAAHGLRDDSVVFLDLYTDVMTTYTNATARGKLLSDGLRLSEEGHRVVYEQVQSRIESMLPASTLQTLQIAPPSRTQVGHR